MKYHYYVTYFHAKTETVNSLSFGLGSLEITSKDPITTMDDIKLIIDVIREKEKINDKIIVISFQLLRKD